MSENIIQRACSVLQEEGLRGFLFRLIGVIGYRRLLLLGRSLEGPLPEVRSSLPLEIDWLGPHDQAEFSAMVSDQYNTQIEARMNKGDRCLAARTHGKLAAVMWACTTSLRMSYLEMDMPLPPGEVYLCGAFTDPAFRGHGIAPTLSVEMLRRFRETGFHRAIRATWPENSPALRAHAKAGFVPCAMVGRLKLGWWRRDFHHPLKV